VCACAVVHHMSLNVGVFVLDLFNNIHVAFLQAYNIP